MKYDIPRFRRLAPVTLAIISIFALTTPAVSHAEKMSRAKGVSMGTGALVGGLVGGPVGLAAGVIAGSLLGEHTDTTRELKVTEVAMDNATQEIFQLENQITEMVLEIEDMEADVSQLETALLTRLEFQVHFRTGDDRLRDQDRERIAMLAKYMHRNSEVSVRLQGHADARGTEEYNAVLAEYRARAVADALLARGVSSSRLQIESFGATQALAQPGDHEGYALDRYVNIEVVSVSVADEEPETIESGVASVQ